MALVPLPPEQRTAAIEHLATLLTTDVIDLDAFESLKNGVLAAATEDDLARVLAHAPSPVRMTPASRRLDGPLVIENRSGAIRLDARWQLARETRIVNGSGAVMIDLREAELDDTVVDLEVTIRSGSLDITVPHGVSLQVVEMRLGSGAMRNDLGGAEALPGMPQIRLHVEVGSGSVRLRRPKPPRARWWQLWRR